MKTLYDVLGVSSQATQEQIENAYQFFLKSPSNNGTEPGEDAVAHAKAIREAYAVLSIPSKRQAYDARLKARQQVTYEVVEPAGFPWFKTMFAILLLGGGLLYKVHADKAELERAALAAEKAKAEAEIAAKRESIAEMRLAQQRLQEERIEQERQRREREQTSREAQLTHERVQRMEVQLVREEAQLAREREQAERKAKLEKQREEQAAEARKRNEIAAMERALSIPIRKH